MGRYVKIKIPHLIFSLAILLVLCLLIFQQISYQSYKKGAQRNISLLEGQIYQANQKIAEINDVYSCYGGICVNKSNEWYIQTPYPISLSGYQKYFYYNVSSGIIWLNYTDNTTFSMFPTVLTGSLVAYMPINKNNLHTLNVGDIILYNLTQPDSSNSTGYIHRIIYINPNYTVFQTKGDNNLLPDKPINASQIVGRVLGIIY